MKFTLRLVGDVLFIVLLGVLIGLFYVYKLLNERKAS
jgi:hypothetical protein